MERWPRDNPGGWFHNAAAFLGLIEANPTMWHRCPQAKYIDLRIDTRNGGFTLRDRDGNLLEVDAVLAAIERDRAFYGKPPLQNLTGTK